MATELKDLEFFKGMLLSTTFYEIFSFLNGSFLN